MNKDDVALVFPGQGSQIVGMGQDLYDNFVVAREVFKEVDQILGFKLSGIMFEGSKSELTKTENAQPALMAVSIAIIRVLEKEFGKKVENIASFVAGHSLGEYSALCAARAITLEQTTKLLQIRGQEMAKCARVSSGAMAAILGVDNITAQEIADLAANDSQVCQVANDNSVGQIVISGSKAAIDKSIKIAKKKGAKRAILLPVSGAFHSVLMQEAAQKMSQALEKVEIKSPVIPIIANVTADLTVDPKVIKDLLTKQIIACVRWRETMLFMEKSGVTKIIEIGSGKVLSGLVSRTCKEVTSKSIQNAADIIGYSKGF